MKRWSRHQGFGIIELLIIIIILLALLVVGWAVFKKLGKQENTNGQSAGQSQQKQEDKQQEPKQAEQKRAAPAAAPVAKGMITGHASYPSERLPEDEEVCAELMSNTATVYCVNVGNNPPHNLSYSLEVPVGEYYVYSKTGNQPGYKAYYNEFVTCGLSVDCPAAGHDKPIKVVVAAGATVRDINPGDWYDF